MSRVTLFFAVIVIVLGGGCSRSALQIELEVKGHDVDDVRVIAGIDKIYWPRLSAGESRKVRSIAKLPADVTVFYTFDHQSRSSPGPEITSDSRVEIVIEPAALQPDEQVRYRVFPVGQ